MARIPINLRSDRAALHVGADMFEAAARTRGRPRNYLGMSQIGADCDRQLWLQYRGFDPLPLDGRMVMLFRFGDRIEDEIIHWLRQAGYKVEGQQEAFSAHGGRFRGHCDGIIHGVTRQAHILECKSCNDRKFKAFQAAGVRKTAPVYYCQAQCYMGYAGLERALFVIQNKNTSALYLERIYFCRSDFEQLHERAGRIIEANDPPGRPFVEDSQTCQWCDYRVVCWRPEEAIVSNRHCGTCYYYGNIQGTWYCRHVEHPFQIQRWGETCPDWRDRFVKALPGRTIEPRRLTLDELEERRKRAA